MVLVKRSQYIDDKEVIDGARVREIIQEYEAEHNLPTRLIPIEEEA